MAFYNTINPADLLNNLNAQAFAIPEDTAGASSPRGVKRSREGSQDDQNGVEVILPEDDAKPRKRGKSTKSAISSPPPRNMSQGVSSTLLQTPQVKNQSLVLESPSAASPPKSTPSKVNKVQPTTRDHTTTQLAPSGDEYEAREIDEDGEKKITPDGRLLGNRTYGLGTFTLVGRGDKLFMLATRCAQHLAYRDSYLLFTKNRSLYKIVASKDEKDEMIQKDVIPFAYRSRGIAVVTAKSMFRQFGSRIIKDGHKVRDDYFETKARNQGFTEDDPAWLKRPGDVVKTKEVPAAGQANDISSIGANAKHQLARGEVIYQQSAYEHAPLMDSDAPGFLQLSMTSDDLRPRDYGDVHRPRQDITGIPYTDRTAPSTEVEIVNQAAQATQVNSAIRAARINRDEYLTNAWNTVHEIEDAPLIEAQILGGGLPEPPPPPPPAAYISPQATRSVPQPGQQSMVSQTPGSMMQPNSFARPHSMMPSPSPSARASMPPNAMVQPMQRPNFPYNPQQQGSNFNYPSASQPMWPAPQATNASPMQTNQMPHYQAPSQSPHPVQQSPHSTLQNPLIQSMGSSHGIPSLGGYQSGGIPGMHTGPLAAQNYLQQAQQRFGAGAQGMMRPGGYQPGAAAQQYMQNQAAGQNNMGMGAGIPGWNMSGQQSNQQQQQGVMGQHQNWGNYGS